MKKRRNQKMKFWQNIIELTIIICIAIIGYIATNTKNTNEINTTENVEQNQQIIFDLNSIPEYTSSPYVEINNNIPYFKDEDYTTETFERYSEWDVLGRSGVAFANICKEIMPKEGEERGDISSVNNLS